MTALAASTALTTGAYQPLLGAGYTTHVVAERVNTLLNRTASQHLINRAGGWGGIFQTPLWAALLGRAAWYMWSWPELTAQTKDYVAKIVEYEANFAAQQPLHYYRNPAGTILTPGDSGAEEVSWLAGAMHVGVVMLPSASPNVSVWERGIVQYALAAWARPADTSNATVVNGRTVAAWINGSNVESNGVVINHSRIASDYSTTLYQNLDGAPLYVLAGRQAPQALRQLLGPVYGAFTSVQFAGGLTTYAANGTIYYPEGNEWGTGQVLPYALTDALALTYGFDPGTAATYLNLHLDAQLGMQTRFTDRHTYANDNEYNYAGREEHAAQLASQLYLALYMRDHALVSWTNAAV